MFCGSVVFFRGLRVNLNSLAFTFCIEIGFWDGLARPTLHFTKAKFSLEAGEKHTTFCITSVCVKSERAILKLY